MGGGARRARPVAFSPSYFEFNAARTLRFHAAELVRGSSPPPCPFPMTRVVCMRAHCVYAIVYAMPVDPRALLFHLFLSSLLPLLPLCRGGKQVIEFLKANFSRATDGPERARNDKPLRLRAFLPTFSSTYLDLFSPCLETALPLPNCAIFRVTTIIKSYHVLAQKVT